MAIVACRNNFWVAVTERGGLLVRGGNEDGQLGIGSQVAALRPRALGGTGPIAGDGAAELEGGMEALALLADDAPEAPAAALAHPFESKVAMVATGNEHTMCVTDDGAVWAWGLNASDALGITHTQTPQQLAQNDHLRRSLVPLRWGAELCNGVSARMVACGDYHTLVLTRAGEVWACGRGREGQTGNPHLPDIVHSPERVAGLPAAVQLVAAGTEFSGAVDADGQVWMWGRSSNNRLGFDQDMPGWHEISAPTGLGFAAFGGEKVVHLSLGYFQSAAVTSTGALWVWGNNDFGQLGLGDFEDCSIPTLVAAGGAPAWGGSCVLMAACGWYHKLVLTKDGCVWSCGQGEFGLLGPGDESDVTVPVRIAPAAFGGARIVFVAAGPFHAFAVTAEGLLYYCGIDNVSPVQTNQETPIPVAASLAPGLRIGRSCSFRRWHALVFCMGTHARLGAEAGLSVLGRDGADAVLAHGARLDGDLARMGEGLLRQLAVRERQD